MHKIEIWLTRVVQAAAVLAAMVMVASLLIGVVYRYILQNSLTWSNEVALLSFTWLVFLTAGLAVRDNSHVRVELIDKVLPEYINWLLNQLIWIAVALTGLYMLWTGFDFIAFTVGQTSPAIRYPIWLRDSALPVAAVLIIVYALLNLRRPGRFQQDKQDAA